MGCNKPRYIGWYKSPMFTNQSWYLVFPMAHLDHPSSWGSSTNVGMMGIKHAKWGWTLPSSPNRWFPTLLAGEEGIPKSRRSMTFMNSLNTQFWSSTTRNFGFCSPETKKKTIPWCRRNLLKTLSLDIHGSCAESSWFPLFGGIFRWQSSMSRTSAVVSTTPPEWTPILRPGNDIPQASQPAGHQNYICNPQKLVRSLTPLCELVVLNS